MDQRVGTEKAAIQELIDMITEFQRYAHNPPHQAFHDLVRLINASRSYATNIIENIIIILLLDHTCI